MSLTNIADNVKLIPKIKTATSFLNFLDPDATEFDFRSFTEKGHNGGGPFSVTGSLDDIAKKLTRLNTGRTPAGVYVTVNRMDGNGVKAENLERIRAVYVDWDNGIPETVPLPPSILIQSSPGKYQAYWLIDPDHTMTLPIFKQVMETIVTQFGGDKGCKDVARVLRLPGFYHRKGAPFRVRFAPKIAELWDCTVAYYTPEEIVTAFPPIKPTNTIEHEPANLKPGQALTLPKRFRHTDYVKLASALEVLDADDRDTWLIVGTALYHENAGAEDDKECWEEWARQSDKFDQADTDKQWKSFGSYVGPKRSIGSIYHAAEALGWKNPTAANKKSAIVTADGSVQKLESGWAIADPRCKERGDPAALENLTQYLEAVGVQPWLNDFDRQIYLRRGKAGDVCIDDGALLDLRMPMHAAGCRMNATLFAEFISFSARKVRGHPVKEYFSNLEWDKTPRLDTWLHTYVGARKTPYHRLVGSKWMIAAVRRVRNPGCKFDTMLVLEGAQYAGKSSVFSILASEKWFGDGVAVGADPRELIEQSSGKLIVECAELSKLGARAVEDVKTFCSRQSDRARAAYGRFAEEVPRQFVLGATTNETEYLLDKTGNRRFWGVAVGAIKLDALRRDRDQLWAEAAHREAQGEVIYLTADEYKLAAVEQEKREVATPLDDQVQALVAEFRAGAIRKADLFDALGFERAADIQGNVARSVAGALRKIGWESKKLKQDGVRIPSFAKADEFGRYFWLTYRAHAKAFSD